MRKKIVAGNWKMNKVSDTAKSLFEEINAHAQEFHGNVAVVIAPPSLYLAAFAKSATSKVCISAQDVSAHSDEGAYTGEFSAAMLKSVGGRYAIVGHSERRSYHGETDALIAKKIRACIDARIIPIYCCGESLEQRESGKHVEVVQNQIHEALSGFSSDELNTLVIAYEPVWAIGTGKTATTEQAQEMHADIRKYVASKFGNAFGDAIRILYGGSCKPSNAEAIFSQKDVDGGLIGGAALNAADFLAIIKAAQ